MRYKEFEAYCPPSISQLWVGLDPNFGNERTLKFTPFKFTKRALSHGQLLQIYYTERNTIEKETIGPRQVDDEMKASMDRRLKSYAFRTVALAPPIAYQTRLEAA